MASIAIRINISTYILFCKVLYILTDTYVSDLFSFLSPTQSLHFIPIGIIESLKNAQAFYSMISLDCPSTSFSQSWLIFRSPERPSLNTIAKATPLYVSYPMLFFINIAQLLYSTYQYLKCYLLLF